MSDPRMVAARAASGGRPRCRFRPASARRFRRPAAGAGKSARLHRSGARARRGARPCAASSGRPASARRRWRRSSRARLGVGFRATSGPVIAARRRPRGAADQSAAARRAVHRRDPSPDARRSRRSSIRRWRISSSTSSSARARRRARCGSTCRLSPWSAPRRARASSRAPLRERFGIPLRLVLLRAGGAGADRRARRAGARHGARRGKARPRSPRRARGTPRVAGAAACAGCAISPRWPAPSASTPGGADAALKRLEVDGRGLDAMDRRYLALHRRELRRRPGGRRDASPRRWPSSATSIEEVIEPYLIQQGLVQRTPRGRVLHRARLPPISALARAAAAGAARPARRGRGGGRLIRRCRATVSSRPVLICIPSASTTRTPTPAGLSTTPTI